MAELSTLLSDIRAGDAHAFRTLVRAQSDRLFTIAFRITGDHGLAEDVVQETFLRVLSYSGTLPREGTAGRWLAKITANCALDIIRGRGARRRREEDHAMRHQPPRRSPEIAVEEEERAKFVWDPARLARCPFNAVRVFGKEAFHCDLCGGSPQCVKVCTTKAITVQRSA